MKDRTLEALRAEVPTWAEAFIGVDRAMRTDMDTSFGVTPLDGGDAPLHGVAPLDCRMLGSLVRVNCHLDALDLGHGCGLGCTDRGGA